MATSTRLKSCRSSLPAAMLLPTKAMRELLPMQKRAMRMKRELGYSI
jgi:hypothetical protein